jgi:hypothetical protein
LEIYVSNLGARPVLVHFWDYIFRTWITVYIPTVAGDATASCPLLPNFTEKIGMSLDMFKAAFQLLTININFVLLYVVE